MKKVLLLLSLIWVSTQGYAQEFIATVKVNTPNVQTTDPKVFEALETSIRDLMNTQKWTEHDYEPQEKIKCNINITILSEISDTRFKGDLSIQSSRPVYNSNYETPMFIHIDKNFAFDYRIGDPVQFSQNVYTDNLSSMLAYYAYIMLGTDYDSYSENGGEPYFQEAQNIVNIVPRNLPAEFKGWKVTDGQRTRYSLIENILSPRMIPYRKAMYEYHRKGLDVMSDDPNLGKEVIINNLKAVEKTNKAYPNTLILAIFSFTKSNELVSIFKKSTLQQKAAAYQIMVKIDPANASKYREIRK